MGHKVLDLYTECWEVLAHYSKTVKKQLDWLQKVIFGKIPAIKWVNFYVLLLLWPLTLMLSVLVTVHVVKKNKKQPKTSIASWDLHWLMFLILHYKFRHAYCVVQFYPWFKVYFPLFGGMVMNDNEIEAKENKI